MTLSQAARIGALALLYTKMASAVPHVSVSIPSISISTPSTPTISIPSVSIPSVSTHPISTPSFSFSVPGWTVCPISTTAAPTITVTSTVTPTSDCSTSAPTPTFSCDAYGYLIQANTLYRVDLTTGAYELIKANVSSPTASINAIGYNVLDNAIYGRLYSSDTSPASIIRINPDGSSAHVATSGINTHIGDVDTRGQYWSSDANAWLVSDLVPNSPTYGAVIANGTAVPFDTSPADWVYMPSAGEYLYSVAKNTTSGGSSLIRFDMGGKAWERVADYPAISGTWGAQYGMNNGTLYASDNVSGQIWQFPLVGGSRPFLVSQGPVSGSNDGARCVLNLLKV